MLASCLDFFFFKQKTAYEMRISDWSSDVCSSDLIDVARAYRRGQFCKRYAIGLQFLWIDDHLILPDEPANARDLGDAFGLGELVPEIGRASCRERVCQYV